jgi:hypothetical protein
MSKLSNAQEITYEVIPPTCNTCNDGVIDFIIPEENDHQYEFLWSNGSTDEDLFGLTVGQYNVQLKNELKEILFYSIEIEDHSDSEVVFKYSHSPCAGYNQGVININPIGYEGEIELVINGQKTKFENKLDGLSPGEYLVSVYDINGLIGEQLIVINEPKAIEINSEVGYLHCLTNSAMIDVDVSGGTGIYSINWDDGSTGMMRHNLSPGRYEVMVTDDNYCITSDVIHIPIHSGSMKVKATSVGESGLESQDGAVDLIIEGGKKPLSFYWSNGYEGEDLFFTEAGTYTVQVTDAEGCNVEISVEVPLYSSATNSSMNFN